MNNLNTLFRYQEIDYEMQVLEEQINLLRTRLTSLSQALHIVPEGVSTYKNDRIADAIAEIIEYEEKLMERIKYQQTRLNDCLNMIKGLSMHEYKIIYLRFIKGLCWYDISLQMNYSIKQCMRIKDMAIQKLKDRFILQPSVDIV